MTQSTTRRAGAPSPNAQSRFGELLGQYADRLALGLAGVGLLLRLIGLGARPFWFDETISVIYARQDFGTLLRLDAGDNHPPGYYLALKLWIGLFGSSETAVRLLSVLPGLAALWLIWLIGRRLWPQQPALGLGATALMALSPFQIYFAQEARNYSTMECFVLLAVYFWLRGLDSNRWRDWLGLGIAGTLGLVCNFTTAFYLVGLGLFCLIRAKTYWQKGVLQRLLITGAGTGLLSGILLLPKLTQRLETIKGYFWIPLPDPLLILRTFYTFIFGASEGALLLPAIGLAWVLLAIVVIQAVSAVAARIRPDLSLGLAFWLAFIPLCLVIIVSYLFQPLYLDKALIGCAPFYYLLVSWAIFRPRSTVRRAGWFLPAVPTMMAIGLALFSLPGIYNGSINPVYIARYDPARADDYLRVQLQPSDFIATATDISWLPLFYYDTSQPRLPDYPLKEYPYANIFPALVETLNTRYATVAELDQHHSGRTWLVFEVAGQPERPLSTTPLDPAKVEWLHSPDWQRDLLARMNSNHHFVSSVVIDQLMLVLYEN